MNEVAGLRSGLAFRSQLVATCFAEERAQALAQPAPHRTEMLGLSPVWYGSTACAQRHQVSGNSAAFSGLAGTLRCWLSITRGIEPKVEISGSPTNRQSSMARVRNRL